MVSVLIPPTPRARGFEPVRKECRVNGEEVMMPIRATKHSAGYDFFCPIDLTIEAGKAEIFWTDVKAFMLDEEMLIGVVRGSVGNKRELMLANTVGIIDADYYSNPDNDGNIGMKLRNLSDHTVKVHRGERVVQCIFVPFLVADNCNTDRERTGGHGSTGK